MQDYYREKSLLMRDLREQPKLQRIRGTGRSWRIKAYGSSVVRD